jgi:hypothetical protein
LTECLVFRDYTKGRILDFEHSFNWFFWQSKVLF